MRTYDVMFMAGSYWLIFRDAGDQQWTADTTTHNIDRERVALIADALNARASA